MSLYKSTCWLLARQAFDTLRAAYYCTITRFSLLARPTYCSMHLLRHSQRPAFVGFGSSILYLGKPGYHFSVIHVVFRVRQWPGSCSSFLVTSSFVVIVIHLPLIYLKFNCHATSPHVEAFRSGACMTRWFITSSFSSTPRRILTSLPGIRKLRLMIFDLIIDVTTNFAGNLIQRCTFWYQFTFSDLWICVIASLTCL